MALFTLVARVTDGMLLVASLPTTEGQDLTTLREHVCCYVSQYRGICESPARSVQARQIIRKLNHHSPLKMTIDSGDFYFRCVSFGKLKVAQMHAPARHVALRSYVIEDGVCFLCLAKQAHARKQTFTFLHAVKNAFVGELQQQHGPECVTARMPPKDFSP